MVLLVNKMWTEVIYATLMPEYQNILFLIVSAIVTTTTRLGSWMMMWNSLSIHIIENFMKWNF